MTRDTGKTVADLITMMQDNRFWTLWGGLIRGRDKHRRAIEAAEDISTKTISVRYPVHPDPIENPSCRRMLRWVKDTLHYINLFGIDLVTGIAQVTGSRLTSKDECKRIALDTARAQLEDNEQERLELLEKIHNLENGGEE